MYVGAQTYIYVHIHVHVIRFLNQRRFEDLGTCSCLETERSFTHLTSKGEKVAAWLLPTGLSLLPEIDLT